MKKFLRLACLVAFAACSPMAGAGAPAGKTTQPAEKPTTPAAPRFWLAKDGQAQAPIVVSPTAGEFSRASAERLAGFLQRIAGATFPVETGDGGRGIVVGTAAEFPEIAREIKLPFLQEGHPLAAQQRYRLRSHAQGVQLIGAMELAVEYVVWDVLYRLGFRQFFPGAAWEIVPSLPAPAIAVDVLEEPNYYDRRISTITVDEDIAEWTMGNRFSWHYLPPTFNLRPNLPRRFPRSWINTTHAYSYIVRDHKEVWASRGRWLPASVPWGRHHRDQRPSSFRTSWGWTDRDRMDGSRRSPWRRRSCDALHTRRRKHVASRVSYSDHREYLLSPRRRVRRHRAALPCRPVATLAIGLRAGNRAIRLDCR